MEAADPKDQMAKDIAVVESAISDLSKLAMVALNPSKKGQAPVEATPEQMADLINAVGDLASTFLTSFVRLSHAEMRKAKALEAQVGWPTPSAGMKHETVNLAAKPKPEFKSVSSKK